VPLVRYPYLIFYKVFADEVIVLRVIHGARKEPWENL
jgi:plasmid stabilization system protein ParE